MSSVTYKDKNAKPTTTLKEMSDSMQLW